MRLCCCFFVHLAQEVVELCFGCGIECRRSGLLRFCRCWLWRSSNSFVNLGLLWLCAGVEEASRDASRLLCARPLLLFRPIVYCLPLLRRRCCRGRCRGLLGLLRLFACSSLLAQQCSCVGHGCEVAKKRLEGEQTEALAQQCRRILYVYVIAGRGCCSCSLARKAQMNAPSREPWAVAVGQNCLAQ